MKAEKQAADRKYKQAIARYKKLVKRFPETPAGYKAAERITPNARSSLARSISAWVRCSSSARRSSSLDRLSTLVMAKPNRRACASNARMATALSPPTPT